MHYVIINERYFPVRDEVLDSVRSDLLDAVRQGGAFITFGGAPHQVEMLITPHTSVRIQRVERPDQGEVDGVASSIAEAETTMTDVDWWLEWG